MHYPPPSSTSSKIPEKPMMPSGEAYKGARLSYALPQGGKADGKQI